MKPTIVVGVDGSDDGKRALEWALETARERGMRLLLVHGIDVGLSAADPYGGGYVFEQLQDVGRLALDSAAALAAEEGIETETRLEVGSAAYALLVQIERRAAFCWSAPRFGLHCLRAPRPLPDRRRATAGWGSKVTASPA